MTTNFTTIASGGAVSGAIALGAVHYSLLGILGVLALLCLFWGPLARLRALFEKDVDEYELPECIEQEWAPATPRSTRDVRHGRYVVALVSDGDPYALSIYDYQQEKEGL